MGVYLLSRSFLLDHLVYMPDIAQVDFRNVLRLTLAM